MFQFELGQVVRDLITGYEGVVIGRTEWLNGCVRYVVQSQKLKDGIPLQEHNFDEQQIEAVKGKKPVKTLKKPTGGPRKDPTRSDVTIRR